MGFIWLRFLHWIAIYWHNHKAQQVLLDFQVKNVSWSTHSSIAKFNSRLAHWRKFLECLWNQTFKKIVNGNPRAVALSTAWIGCGEHNDSAWSIHWKFNGKGCWPYRNLLKFSLGPGLPPVFWSFSDHPYNAKSCKTWKGFMRTLKVWVKMFAWCKFCWELSPGHKACNAFVTTTIYQY